LALTAAMAAAALALLPQLPEAAPEAPLTLAIWMVALLTLATELAAVHRHGQKHTHSLTLSEVTLVIGLAFAAPVDLVLGRVVAGLAVYLMYRRLPLLKVGFNTMMFALETSAAVVVYRAVLGDGSPALPGGWAAAAAGVAAATLVGVGAMRAIMAFDGGPASRREISQATFLSLSVTGAATTLGLLAVAALWSHAAAFVLIGMVAAIAFGVLRSLMDHFALQELRARMDVVLSRCAEAPERLREVLEEIRNLLRAGSVEVIVPVAHGNEAVRMKLDGPDDFDTASVRPDRLGHILDGLARARRAPLLLGESDDHEVIRLELRSRGFGRSVVVPLRRRGRVIGYLAAGAKGGPERGFSRADLHVLCEVARWIERIKLEPAGYGV
jgi:hypothetical protein